MLYDYSPNRDGHPRVLTCPLCKSGSSAFYDTTRARSEWEHIRCPSCKQPFLLAEAHDAMLLDGCPEGYQLWGNCIVVTRGVICPQGGSVLIDVRGHLNRVLRLTYGTASGICLAGGVGLKFVPQGYLLVSVAPDPHIPPRHAAPMDLIVVAIGYGQEAISLPLWRELMLQARVAAGTSPDLVPILVCNAVEAYLEHALPTVETQNRPKGWSRSVKQATHVSLADLLGPSGWADLRVVLNYRHMTAHGMDPLEALPSIVRLEEHRWRTRQYQLEDGHGVSPANRLALRTGLDAIRVVRQRLHLVSRAQKDR